MGVTLYVQRAPSGMKHAQSHRAAFDLLAAGLRRKYGLSESELAYGTGEHGKPYLIGRGEIQFSVSHTDGMVACGIASVPLGVDVERLRPVRDRVAKRVFSPEELEWFIRRGSTEADFFRLWTLKESYVKATGDGLSFPLSRAAFTISGQGRIECGCPGYRFRQFHLGGEFILSVCARASHGRGGGPKDNMKEDFYGGTNN